MGVWDEAMKLHKDKAAEMQAALAAERERRGNSPKAIAFDKRARQQKET